MNEKTQNTMNQATQLQTMLRTAIYQHDQIHGDQWNEGDLQDQLESRLAEANQAALAAGCDLEYVLDSNVSVLAGLMNRMEAPS